MDRIAAQYKQDGYSYDQRIVCQTDTYSVYYGVRVDHPEQLLAGNYQAEVVYTATTNGSTGTKHR